MWSLWKCRKIPFDAADAAADAEQGTEREVAEGDEEGGCPYSETLKGMLEIVEP